MDVVVGNVVISTKADKDFVCGIRNKVIFYYFNIIVVVLFGNPFITDKLTVIMFVLYGIKHFGIL